MTAKSTLLLISAFLCLSSFYSALPQDKFTCNVYIPNAFSPNDDGVNDVFQPNVGCPITAFDLKIFSRSGQLIFSTQNSEDGWDGTSKGQLAAASAYVYLLKVTYDQEGDAKSELKTGDVALIR